MRQVFYSSPWIHEPEPEELFRIYAAYGERIKLKQESISRIQEKMRLFAI